MAADLIAERASHSSAFSAVVKKPYSSFSVDAILSTQDATSSNGSISSSISPTVTSSALSSSPNYISRLPQFSAQQLAYQQFFNLNTVLSSSPISSFNSSLQPFFGSPNNSPISSQIKLSPNHTPSPKKSPKSPLFATIKRSPNSCSPPLSGKTSPGEKLENRLHSPQNINRHPIHSLNQSISPNRTPQQSPQDLSTSNNGIPTSDSEMEDEEEIHVDNDQDMPHDNLPPVIDPVPHFPHHLIHPRYPQPQHGGIPPPNPLQGSGWPFQQYIHQQLALRALESKYWE